jgi:hypothetical protein
LAVREVISDPFDGPFWIPAEETWVSREMFPCPKAAIGQLDHATSQIRASTGKSMQQNLRDRVNFFYDRRNRPRGGRAPIVVAGRLVD